MTTEEKNRSDALFSLWNSMWQRIQERRTTEWQLTLTIWAGLAALGVLFVKSESPLRHLTASSTGFVWVGLVFIVALHHYYLRHAGKRHEQNRRFAEKVLERVAKLPGLSTIDKDWDDTIGKPRKTLLGLDWGHSVQFTLSLLLAGIVGYLGYLSKIDP